MTNLCISFLSGASLTALAAYLAGGGMRAGILIGIALVLIPLFAWPRRAADLLLRFARALEAFRAKPEAVKLAVVRSNALRADTPDQRKTELSDVQLEVVSALQNLGMRKDEAQRAVLSHPDNEDFETLFNQVMLRRAA